MNSRPLVEDLGDSSMSPYKRYLNMFVGKPTFGALLLYEFCTSFLGKFPGAAGYAIRKKCYRWILGKVGGGTVFGAGMVLRCPSRVEIGSDVMIDDGVVIDAKGDGSAINLGDQILLGRNSILSCNDSSLSIGNFVSIGPFCFIVSRSVVDIGDNVAIGAGTKILGGGHDFSDPDTPVIHQERTSKGITIGDGAWIGIGASILDGVTIGKNSIVGAGAVVSKDVPDWTVAIGNPARVVEKRKKVEPQE